MIKIFLATFEVEEPIEYIFEKLELGTTQRKKIIVI